MALLLDGDDAGAGEALDELQPVLDGLPADARLAGRALAACFGPGPLRACPASLDALVKAFPEDSEVEFWYGRALARVKGRSLEAARHLRAALDRDPNNLPAVAELAATLAGLGAADNAVAVLTAARERNPAAGDRIQALIDGYQGS
jgi:predicted Zn-dependent protease